MTIIKISQKKCFNGTQYIYSHQSVTTNCIMRFGVYLPPQAATKKVPVLYWLSGLTCTEENFINKAGAQRMASKLGLAIVTPDTSPRGLGIVGEEDSYDIGTGAGFYLDAQQVPWSEGYKMSSYITNELRMIVEKNLPIDNTRVGIFGHSMGGHGALILALKNPNYFKTVSAFSPICSPMRSPWGQHAFRTYLGNDQAAWQDYDATYLIETIGWAGPAILVDQGTEDEFIEQQLKPELLQEACKKAKVPLQMRFQEGYDHSYFFISTFIEDHLIFHADYLSAIR